MKDRERDGWFETKVTNWSLGNDVIYIVTGCEQNPRSDTYNTFRHIGREINVKWSTHHPVMFRVMRTVQCCLFYFTSHLLYNEGLLAQLQMHLLWQHQQSNMKHTHTNDQSTIWKGFT